MYFKVCRKIVGKFLKVLYLCETTFEIQFFMAVIFSLESPGKDGLATIRIRVQNRIPKIDVKQKTPLFILPKIWECDRNSAKFSKYLANPEIKQLFGDIDEIRRVIEGKISSGIALNASDVHAIVDEIVFHREYEAKRKAEEDAAREKELKNKMTLIKFIDQYILEASNGGRQTDRGTNYSPNTIKAIKQTMTQFKKFCQWKKHNYDFDEINMNFYHEFTAYLKMEIKDRKGNVKKVAYNVNSIGKCIKQLKVIMGAAEIEGYHSNSIWKDKKFKGAKIDVDNIYLTREDLAKIQALDLSTWSEGYSWARDIFMVGVWTAQRVSDYNNITRDQIDVHTKRWIEDVPDPEHPGQTIPKISSKDIMFISIRQQKTGAQISIPISSDLKAILEKYNYCLPHLEDQVINRYIKEIAKAAGLTENVEIIETTGGTPKRVMKPKYQMVHTHTARRTGATLMYLSGMDVYDIIKITGHSTPMMLKKYIKADKLEVLEKITDKYTYFD